MQGVASPVWTLRVVGAEHRMNAAELLNSHIGGEVPLWLDRLRHSAEANPASSELIPRGWLGTTANGTVIGYMVNTPMRYRNAAGGKLLPCAIHSLAVHPEFKGAGNRGIAMPQSRTGGREGQNEKSQELNPSAVRKSNCHPRKSFGAGRPKVSSPPERGCENAHPRRDRHESHGR